MNRLVVAEKPSVAQSIAKVLGATQRGEGYLHGNGYTVSWCVGHLVELASAEQYDPKYKRWAREDLPILPGEWRYTVPKDKRKQMAVLQKLMADPDVEEIVCATDAGREGELIFRLVYQHCGCTKQVLRLWISSMEDSAIKAGFDALKPAADYDALFHAARCRQLADWLVGINGTRLFSSVYGRTLNVGRVMTPTLAMMVQREADIAAFTPKPFYTVRLDAGGVTANSGRMEDKAAAGELLAACDGKPATVQTLETRKGSEKPPALYDLTSLQRDANRLLGYTAAQTLALVQSLYEKKLATYPRTDSRYITSDMAAGLPALCASAAFALPFTKGMALETDAARVVNDAKVSDHHAIIPTATMPGADLSALPTAEAAVLHMICARLLCATSPAHTYEETAATIECGGSVFAAKGRHVLAEGWKALDAAYRATLQETEEEKQAAGGLPQLTEGQALGQANAQVREGKTTPPRHFTEDSLLAFMETAGQRDAAPNSGFAGEIPEDAERKGLGTPATRAATIEKLVAGGFVERKKAKKATHLLPTETGVNLVAVLPEMLKAPALTAEWEHKLKQIEQGEVSPDTFIGGIEAMTRELVQGYVAPEGAQSLFPSQRPVVGACPRCGGRVLQNKKGYACESRDCGFALWKSSRFFAAKRKTLTPEIAAALLKDGRAPLRGCHSEKTGKTYDAVAVLDDPGSGFVNFKLEFDK